MPRIIIGGPPHSGKSTVMTLLERNLKQKNVSVGLIDLDFASPTIEWLKGEETKTLRNMRKQPWTPKLARRSKKAFIRCDKKYNICLGDSPGKITNVTKKLTSGADGAIILSRDKKETAKWKKFYSSRRIPIVCELDSRLMGMSDFNAKKDRGTAVNMSRRLLIRGKLSHRNVAIEGCAFEISDRFGTRFKER